ncbi:helix-turn-helix transcriptional regulator [Streptomyces sp. NBC_01335]|uniref:helix-turn-helix domain-containing protein n=1 Tax=Streptomyces sp. NBC_01335 TaxID=2903828 RepID=UPI002E0F45D9|nr:helix-turn-helix transcriptional regulator [Streptomyces sp. NBC_01335]
MVEARPNVHRRRFGAAMKQLREAAGLSLEEAATLLGLSGKPALSKIENGRQNLSGLALTGLFAVYGVDSEETKATARAMAALAAPGKLTNLVAQYGDSIQTDSFADFLTLESLAIRSTSFLQVIPGLLQTDEYATAVVESSGMWASEREVAAFVELRRARKAVLTREDPLDLRCFLDEVALRRVVGGPAVMSRQLDALLRAMDASSNVTLNVLPFGAGEHSALDGPFQLLEFPAGPPVVVVETKSTVAYFEEDRDVRYYRSALDDLSKRALDTQASRRFIQELTKECHEE